MKIIFRDLDQQHSGKTGLKYSSLLFWVWKFREFTFSGLQKERFLLFLGAEFLLGLSPLSLLIKRAPPGTWNDHLIFFQIGKPHCQ